ncbi:nitrogen permease regulator of amino acid transport activity 3-domain-containing protein [Aspergillus karnatakaensis]|uniref:nitrogen permease regulator 3 family protein n=1 Tax=Aspergillus karnatakaensis TaxID=1810916 RepID=UPI003CCDBA10
MSSIARPPDPCLVAIVLIARSRAGPRFVFHYPPKPLTDNALRTPAKPRRTSRSKSRQSSKSNDSTSSDDSHSSSDEDEEENHAQSSHVAGSNLNIRRASNFGIDDNSVSASPGADNQRPGPSRSYFKKRGTNSDVETDSAAGSDRQEDGSRDTDGPRVPIESILGLPVDVWEKLLSPSPSWHKRRFEVGINDLAFVGWPVFIREDGGWRKQRRKKKKRKQRAEWEGGDIGHNDTADDSQEDGGDTIAASTETLSPVTAKNPRASVSSMRSSKIASESLDSDDKDSMTMFNVVFVMDPPLLEYSMRVREIYDNIIKKFTKALKWEQARTNYVWRESQHILHIKEKAKEKRTCLNTLYTDLINQSSLARAICTLYTSISASKIASVTLSPDVSISVQIPPLTSTPYLPAQTDQAYPGLWLTTADSITPADDPTTDENTAPHQVMAKHFALLLLDSEAAIIKDVEAAGGALAPPLVHYIRCSKPTKSFVQISQSSGIPLPTIQFLASHLVYWRRARAIPPLHQRDIYIVSPNCDLSKLEVAITAFQQAFPTLPSLPKMLSALSGSPRPYGNFIPSKDHKATYFQILAWLLRGGWVTQIRSFARIKISPEVKMAVEKAIRREEVDKYLSRDRSTSLTSDKAKAIDDGTFEGDSFDDASSSSSSSLASHGSGDLTPMANRSKAETGLDLSHSLLDRSASLNTASLILLPHKASPLESRWLDELVARFPEYPADLASNEDHIGADALEGDSEAAVVRTSLKQVWPTYVKYFNGYDALEKISVRENHKRKLVAMVLARLGVPIPQIPLEPHPKEHVLVTFRHW